MSIQTYRLAGAAMLIFWAMATVARADSPRAVTKAAPTFERDIRPILKAYCFECHGEGAKTKGGLDLRLVRFMKTGGEHGPALVLQQPEKSLLIDRLRKQEMPPGKKKLSTAELRLVADWIQDGAKTEHAEPDKLQPGYFISDIDRRFWAFQEIVRPAVPVVSADAHPIDAFIQQRLQQAGLSFSPLADKITLLRRATFDLHGLPPTLQETEAFLKDSATDAYEKVIERLLASPRYGERWARHWLDVAGYADSEGYSADDPLRLSAWKYRDYVIRSFQGDKPYDLFLREQLAGDELVRPPYAELPITERDKLIATGFLRMAPDGTGGRDVNQKEAREQVISDTLKIVSSSILGLTVSCAQCHHHRYDPIAQEDYYRLRAIFEPAFNIPNWKNPAARQVSLNTSAHKAEAARIEAEAVKLDKARTAKETEAIEAVFKKELAKLPEAIQPAALAARNAPLAKRSAEQKKLLQQYPSLNVSAGSLYLYDKKAADELKKMTDDATAVRAKKPQEEVVRALTESPGEVPVTRLYHRGDPDQPKEVIAPGGLEILSHRAKYQIVTPTQHPSTGRRLALANWLTDPDHPLVSRVFVNRVWMHHFGRGLVGTPSDFGHLGERPSHPELLDWLAREFMQPTDSAATPWSIKRLHRLIVMSKTYRQDSKRTTDKDQIDPDNRLLSRMSIRRLEAEAIRDSILAVSGKLSLKMWGPPVPIRENEVGLVVVGKGVKDLARGRTTVEELPADEEFRRGIYITVRRSMPLTLHAAFDAPLLEPNCEARIASTNAPAALVLLNDPFVQAQAAALADRLVQGAGHDPAQQIALAWKLCYSRPPTSKESQQALELLSTVKKGPAQETIRPLDIFCWSLLNTNRFIYID